MASPATRIGRSAAKGSGTGDVTDTTIASPRLAVAGDARPRRFLASSEHGLVALRQLNGPSRLTANWIIAGLALDIVEVEHKRALVAQQQKRGSVAVTTTGSRTITSSEA
jgi:hypothetical protein